MGDHLSSRPAVGCVWVAISLCHQTSSSSVAGVRLMAKIRWVEGNRGCLSVINICTTLLLLLLMLAQHIPSVAIRIIPYGYTKSQKIWGALGGSSAAEEVPTTGYRACSVKEVLQLWWHIMCSFLPLPKKLCFGVFICLSVCLSRCLSVSLSVSLLVFAVGQI